MFGAILKATNCSFQKGIAFCRSIYVKKVMELLAFKFEQPSYKTSVSLGLTFLASIIIFASSYRKKNISRFFQ